MRKVKIEQSWYKALESQWNQPYFARLAEAVHNEYRAGAVFPPGPQIFAAFDACPFNDVKVVILGQDPYHDIGQANGLAFSVAPGVPNPPSLVNIFREVNSDTGAPIPENGDLTRWARQGVLLLNSSLTVRAHQPASHANIGWQTLTDEAILRLAQDREHLVFMLWGAFAQRKGAFIDPNKHLVLKSPHPSPLSAHRGFFGNHHFSLANQYLVEHDKTPIEW